MTNVLNKVIYKEFGKFSFGKVDVEIHHDKIKMWCKDETSIFAIAQNQSVKEKYKSLFIKTFHNLVYEGYLNSFGVLNIHHCLSADDEYNKTFVIDGAENV